MVAEVDVKIWNYCLNSHTIDKNMSQTLGIGCDRKKLKVLNFCKIAFVYRPFLFWLFHFTGLWQEDPSFNSLFSAFQKLSKYNTVVWIQYFGSTWLKINLENEVWMVNSLEDYPWQEVKAWCYNKEALWGICSKKKKWSYNSWCLLWLLQEVGDKKFVFFGRLIERRIFLN